MWGCACPRGKAWDTRCRRHRRPPAHHPCTPPPSPFSPRFTPALHPSSILSLLKTPFPRESQSQVSASLFSMMGGETQTGCDPGREDGDKHDQWCRRGPALGPAQMEGRWAGGKGQLQSPRASAASLPPHCLLVSPARPLLAALLSSQRTPSARSPGPQLRREPERGSPPSPCTGGEREAGGRGQAGRRASGGEAGRGVSESINHAPLRSCLTHTSRTGCQ